MKRLGLIAALLIGLLVLVPATGAEAFDACEPRCEQVIELPPLVGGNEEMIISAPASPATSSEQVISTVKSKKVKVKLHKKKGAKKPKGPRR